jgi:hypothetical protein
MKSGVLHATEISWELSNQLLNLIHFCTRTWKNVKIKVTYLSTTVHEELIGIVGNIVPNEVINQVN